MSVARHGLVIGKEDRKVYHPQRITQAFARKAKAAGLPAIRLHDVRYANATASPEAGVPLKVLSERLGHSSITVTGDHMHVRQRGPGTVKVYGVDVGTVGTTADRERDVGTASPPDGCQRVASQRERHAGPSRADMNWVTPQFDKRGPAMFHRHRDHGSEPDAPAPAAPRRATVRLLKTDEDLREAIERARAFEQARADGGSGRVLRYDRYLIDGRLAEVVQIDPSGAAGVRSQNEHEADD